MTDPEFGEEWKPILALLPAPIPQGEDGWLDFIARGYNDEFQKAFVDAIQARAVVQEDDTATMRRVDEIKSAQMLVATLPRLIAIARASEANDFQIAEQLHHMQHGPSAWATLTDLGRAEYTKRLARAREGAAIARAAGGKQ